MFALAALAATGAFAQSSVQIVGTFDPSVANQKISYGDGKSVTNNLVRNNSQGTSQITFKGTEDLGGGLKASFLLENDFDARYDANGPEGVSTAGVRGVNMGAFGGEQFLALEGGFGKIQVGAANTPSLTTQASRQPFSTKIGGGFNGVTGTGHVRSNNSIVLTSPTFSGFTVAAAYAFNQKAAPMPATGDVAIANANTGASSTNSTIGNNQTSISDIGLFYANGPIAAGVSLWQTSAYDVLGSATTTAYSAKAVNQTNMFASYDMGVAKLTVGYHTEKQDYHTSVNAAATTAAANGAVMAIGSQTTARGINAEGWNLAAVVPLSANLNLLANYGELKDKLAERSAFPLNKKISAIGLKYALSKNTSLYARYVDETNENIAAAYTNSTWAVAGTVALPATLAKSGAGTNYLGGAGSSNTAAKVTTALVGVQMNF